MKVVGDIQPTSAKDLLRVAQTDFCVRKLNLSKISKSFIVR